MNCLTRKINTKDFIFVLLVIMCKKNFTKIKTLFYLPLHVASAILNIPTSDLTKICQQNGMRGWPYRKKYKQPIIMKNKNVMFMEFKIKKQSLNGSRKSCPNPILPSFNNLINSIRN